METFRVLSEELETKNRQLEDADEQLNKFYELRAKVIKLFMKLKDLTILLYF